MADDKPIPPMVVNVDELKEIDRSTGPFGAAYMSLTPSMVPRGGKLGINRMRLPKGRTTVPFHYHLREDEVFFILEGRGVLRYGDELRELRAGDCISCPSGTRIAHQIANPFDDDLVYLAVGPYDPHEVCVYPDSGKVMVRGLKQIGQLSSTQYLEHEPSPPQIFALAAKQGLGPSDS